MFLSSTACRYSSQKRTILRFSPVSSTSVFGMYVVEQPASGSEVRTRPPSTTRGARGAREKIRVIIGLYRPRQALLREDSRVSSKEREEVKSQAQILEPRRWGGWC